MMHSTASYGVNTTQIVRKNKIPQTLRGIPQGGPQNFARVMGNKEGNPVCYQVSLLIHMPDNRYMVAVKERSDVPKKGMQGRGPDSLQDPCDNCGQVSLKNDVLARRILVA